MLFSLFDVVLYRCDVVILMSRVEMNSRALPCNNFCIQLKIAASLRGNLNVFIESFKISEK